MVITVGHCAAKILTDVLDAQFPVPLGQAADLAKPRKETLKAFSSEPAANAHKQRHPCIPNKFFMNQKSNKTWLLST